VLMDDQHWDECVASVNYIKANSKYRWMIQTKELVSTSRVNISYTDKQRNFFKYELKRFPSIIWILKNLHLLFKGHVKLFESKYTVNGKKRRATSQYYITTQENNFKGWECAIGVESVYIDFDGELKGSCGQLIFRSKVNFQLEVFVFTNAKPRMITHNLNSKSMNSSEENIAESDSGDITL